jgi:hypothetical protein
MKGVTDNKNKPLTTSYVRVSGITLAATINSPEKNALKFLKNILVDPENGIGYNAQKTLAHLLNNGPIKSLFVDIKCVKSMKDVLHSNGQGHLKNTSSAVSNSTAATSGNHRDREATKNQPAKAPAGASGRTRAQGGNGRAGIRRPGSSSRGRSASSGSGSRSSSRSNSGSGSD